MKSFVINMLKDNLPPTYLYHNYKHTLYVIEKALEIGSHEGCTAAELDLLHVAALWHDTGYITTYKNHEEESCKMVHQYLPGYGFSTEQIEKIVGMIMATRIPQMPNNKLEEILADADLEYLGTRDFLIKSENLFHEMHSLHPDFTKAKWDELQISFLQKHHYFTTFCKLKKEPIKRKHLHDLLHHR